MNLKLNKNPLSKKTFLISQILTLNVPSKDAI